MHICTAFYVLLFMQFYDFSRAETLVIYLTIGCVIALETVNTAIESAVDLCSPTYHKLAEKAKDAAAGAVLVISLAALIIGLYLFWDTTAFKLIFDFFKNHFWAFISLIISLVLSFLFVFCIKRPNKNINFNHK